MKTIFLIRHAEAHSGKKNLTDYDRPLVPKGEKCAKRMAKRLREELIAPDLVISSPATRALSTAHIFADVLRFPIKHITLKAAIYDSTNSDLFLGIIQGIENKHHSILLIGHEPTLSEFASCLIKDFHASIPKAGVVGVTFDKTSWQDIAPGEGTITLFDFPTNKLKKNDVIKKFKKDLRENLCDQLNSNLASIDPELAKKIKSQVKKTSANLAKKFVQAAKDYGDQSFVNKLTQNYCNKQAGGKTTQPVATKREDRILKEPPKKVAALKSNIKGKMQKVRSATKSSKTGQKNVGSIRAKVKTQSTTTTKNRRNRKTARPINTARKKTTSRVTKATKVDSNSS